jgi:hypothetical protein
MKVRRFSFAFVQAFDSMLSSYPGDSKPAVLI